jgi:hypothetical protein
MTMTTQTAIDVERVQSFAGKVLGDLAGTMASVLAIFGDRLGLFRALADGGAATSFELAERASVSERYAREWLYGLHAAGYLEHDREHGRFSLPAEHAEVLAVEGGPFFVGGGYQALSGELRLLDRLSEAFRSGGGVPQTAYLDDTFEGMRRFSLPWYEHQLIQEWIPALEGARESSRPAPATPTSAAAPGTHSSSSPRRSPARRSSVTTRLRARSNGPDTRSRTPDSPTGCASSCSTPPAACPSNTT